MTGYTGGNTTGFASPAGECESARGFDVHQRVNHQIELGFMGSQRDADLDKRVIVGPGVARKERAARVRELLPGVGLRALFEGQVPRSQSATRREGMLFIFSAFRAPLHSQATQIMIFSTKYEAMRVATPLAALVRLYKQI